MEGRQARQALKAAFMPEMWVVAGSNGAGKTTLTKRVLQKELGSLVWLNPDETTIDLARLYPDLDVADRGFAILAAAQVSEVRADCLISCGRDFLAETVLSSEKYLSRVLKA